MLSTSVIIVRYSKSLYSLSMNLRFICNIRKQFVEDKKIHLNMFLFATIFFSNNVNIILCLFFNG